MKSFLVIPSFLARLLCSLAVEGPHQMSKQPDTDVTYKAHTRMYRQISWAEFPIKALQKTWPSGKREQEESVRSD